MEAEQSTQPCSVALGHLLSTGFLCPPVLLPPNLETLLCYGRCFFTVPELPCNPAASDVPSAQGALCPQALSLSLPLSQEGLRAAVGCGRAGTAGEACAACCLPAVPPHPPAAHWLTLLGTWSPLAAALCHHWQALGCLIEVARAGSPGVQAIGCSPCMSQPRGPGCPSPPSPHLPWQRCAQSAVCLVPSTGASQWSVSACSALPLPPAPPAGAAQPAAVCQLPASPRCWCCGCWATSTDLLQQLHVPFGKPMAGVSVVMGACVGDLCLHGLILLALRRGAAPVCGQV